MKNALFEALQADLKPQYGVDVVRDFAITRQLDRLLKKFTGKVEVGNTTPQSHSAIKLFLEMNNLVKETVPAYLTSTYCLMLETLLSLH